MKSTTRKSIPAVAGLSLALVLVGCGSEIAGVPYRTLQRTVAGNYRAAELFDLPPQVKATSDGTDIRLSLGSYATFTGRILIPGGAPDGSDIDERISGDWRVEEQLVLLDFDSEVTGFPQAMTLRIFFLGDRVELSGATDVHGQPIVLDLSKPLPPDASSDEGGSGNSPPSF